jgi:energy-coupling factor transporter transmembrane protein EcfT
LDLIILALIVLGAIILFIVTRFVGKVIGLIVKIMVLIILVLAILTVIVYKDMDSLRKGFAEENNTFFLYENNKLYTAVTLRPLTNLNLSIDSFKYFTKEEISQSEGELNNKNYAALLSNNYRIFLFKPVVINKPYNLDLLIAMNEGDLLNIIMSDDPFLVFAEKTQEKYNLTAEDLKAGFKDIYGSEEKFKGYLFAALLANYFQKQEPGELVRNLKEKTIQVYPESISFKIIKYLPWV